MMLAWLATWTVLTFWLCYRSARVGYRVGVIEGLKIGRFERDCPREIARSYPAAQRIVDDHDVKMLMGE